MSQLHYRRHFMHDWRGGTRGMSFELQGAYADVCDEITLQAGPAVLDVQEMARRGGSNARAVKRLLDELVKRGKLVVESDGRYRNGRANWEVEDALKRIDAKGQVSAKLSAKHEKSLPQTLAETLPQTLAETAPENITNSTEPMPYARATIARDDRASRAHSPPAKSGAPPSPQAGRAAQPTSKVSSSASEARNEIGYGGASQAAARSPAIGGHSLATPPASVNGDNLPRRRTSDWDMPSAPGPKSQTKFLQAEAAFQAGNKAALDPLPGIPWASSNPALSAKIRTQLGLSLPEDNHETDPPADEDDHGFAQRHERAPDPEGFEAYQAGPRNGDPEAPPAEFAAKHADPGNPDDETRPLLSDEDFGGLP
jgi:hypothetical protein